MKTSLLLCLVGLIVFCAFGYGMAHRRGGNRRERGGRRDETNRGMAHVRNMCHGVMRRSRIQPDGINCTAYDEVVDSDIADLYTDQYEDVFQTWIDLLNTMTNREMESDDDDVDDDDRRARSEDDELMMMCKRKFCFMHKFKQRLVDDAEDIPPFCKVEGRTAAAWETLRQAQRPGPGEQHQPMTVERYTIIFCAKAHNPHMLGGRRGGPGGGRRGRGKNGKKGGRRPGGRRGNRRRGRPSDAQEVPMEP